jgi:hypothetical protein
MTLYGTTIVPRDVVWRGEEVIHEQVQVQAVQGTVVEGDDALAEDNRR